MNDTFSTKDFDTLAEFIKPLLKEGNQVRIVPDCEGVLMVDYCSPEYAFESFELYNEDENTLNGDPIKYGD